MEGGGESQTRGGGEGQFLSEKMLKTRLKLCLTLNKEENIFWDKTVGLLLQIRVFIF